MNTVYDAIVIGAGQAGLAAGYHLQLAGLRFLILEAGEEPVGSWPHYYNNLALNSAARYSALPGLPFPGDPKHYPTRNEVAVYLRRYASHFSLPVMTATRVVGVKRVGRLFRLNTADNRCFTARAIVAATGFFGRPNLPQLPGQHQFRGGLLHMADYRDPEPFRGQRIVIVGGANGAVQVGAELAQVASVTLATRQPIRFLPQKLLGQDIHFWLRLTGLDYAQWLGQKSMLVYDTGHYKRMISAGQPDRRPMIIGFTDHGVIWDDGRHEKVDTVIFATGYLPHLPYLRGLGAFDETGRVLHHHGISTSVPGLYYVGLARQRSVASTTLRGAGVDAGVVVNRLQRTYHAQTQGSASRSAQQWLARSGELVNLISLMTQAAKQQASPKVVGDALVHSLIVGAGFFGVGNGAALYAHN